MASELAKKIYQLEWSQIDVIDAELQEVRQVLIELQTGTVDLGEGHEELHWCQPLGECDSRCQRARDLMEKLEVKP